MCCCEGAERMGAGQANGQTDQTGRRSAAQRSGIAMPQRVFKRSSLLHSTRCCSHSFVDSDARCGGAVQGSGSGSASGGRRVRATVGREQWDATADSTARARQAHSGHAHNTHTTERTPAAATHTRQTNAGQRTQTDRQTRTMAGQNNRQRNLRKEKRFLEKKQPSWTIRSSVERCAMDQ